MPFEYKPPNKNLPEYKVPKMCSECISQGLIKSVFYSIQRCTNESTDRLTEGLTRVII